MRKVFVFFYHIALSVLFSTVIYAEKTDIADIPIYKNADAALEERVSDLLEHLTLAEKISLLSGEKYMETRHIARLNIPPMKMADGPHGLRPGKATCFPTGISMGACWNPKLVSEVGTALAYEARDRKVNVLLGPCVNLHRTPLGGRNFESFSEDPYLAAQIAVAYIQGVQQVGVAACIKHFAVNNQEHERTTISAELDKRTLREIYLPVFRAAVKEADVWGVMAAYNKVNGDYCCENRGLLTTILKNEWGFRGLVVSDWNATHNAGKSARAGLDLEMPGPGHYYSNMLLREVERGNVAEKTISDKVSRILRILFLTGLFDQPAPPMTKPASRTKHSILAHELACEAIVLLKNKDNILPLEINKIKSIAVIGPNAAEARLGGGGSSEVKSFYSVSPLKGLRDSAPGQINIRYVQGCLMENELFPIDSQYLIPPDDSSTPHGLRGEYYNNTKLAGNPVNVRIDENILFQWGDDSPLSGLSSNRFSIRWRGKLVAPKTGNYKLGMNSDDGVRLYLNDKLLIDHWADHAPKVFSTKIYMEAGERYDLQIEYYENQGSATAMLGWALPTNGFKDAKIVAEESDVAIVFAGLSSQFEGEGVDRTTFEMPELQAELIATVAQANTNTIVVLINGTPLHMGLWLDKVSAVIEAWYPGQEGGNAIADMLFGKVNPSGKLPTTFPKEIEDTPSFNNYPGEKGLVQHAEGIFTGYRHYEKNAVEPLFPFGHGLSYTSFKYSTLNISSSEKGAIFPLKVSAKVKNTGQRTGKEVVQLYIRDIESSQERPIKELKGFEKVLLKPGEQKIVKFVLNKKAFSFYDPHQNCWVAEPGDFEILVGSSSSDIRLKAAFNLEKK